MAALRCTRPPTMAWPTALSCFWLTVPKWTARITKVPAFHSPLRSEALHSLANVRMARNYSSAQGCMRKTKRGSGDASRTRGVSDRPRCLWSDGRSQGYLSDYLSVFMANPSTPTAAITCNLTVLEILRQKNASMDAEGASPVYHCRSAGSTHHTSRPINRQERNHSFPPLVRTHQRSGGG